MNTEICCQFLLFTQPPHATLFDFQHLSLGQFSLRALFTLRRVPAILCLAIIDVVLVCSRKKMIDPATRRIVAVVKDLDTVRNGAKCLRPDKTVNKPPFSIDDDGSVPIFIPVANPQMTQIGLFNAVTKELKQWNWGPIHVVAARVEALTLGGKLTASTETGLSGRLREHSGLASVVSRPRMLETSRGLYCVHYSSHEVAA